jgi:hypothetical protein
VHHSRQNRLNRRQFLWVFLPCLCVAGIAGENHLRQGCNTVAARQQKIAQM